MFTPQNIAIGVVAILLVAINVGPLVGWAFSAAKSLPLPGRKPAADRTPGEVLDCLVSDMDFLKAHTDTPPELLNAIYAVAPYLMQDKTKPVA